jgi:hypothetical protein
MILIIKTENQSPLINVRQKYLIYPAGLSWPVYFAKRHTMLELELKNTIQAA